MRSADEIKSTSRSDKLKALSPKGKSRIKNQYRGRLAPSPTGYLHLGHARTFWVAWQRARATHGKLIFRNENLDYQRCKPEFVRAMFEDLRWLGLDWDEGPDITPLSGKGGQLGD